MKTYSLRVVTVLLSIIIVAIAGCGSSSPVLSLSVVADCPSAVHSPHGSVPFGEKACSPDGAKYAREIEPKDQGRIGVFDAHTDELLTEIRMGENKNDLKGLSWSPDSRWLSVMYHHGSGGYIAIVNAVTGEQVKSITINRWYHSMEFSEDGTSIVAENDILEIGPLPTQAPAAISTLDVERPDNLYAWTCSAADSWPNGLLKSMNGGNEWTPINTKGLGEKCEGFYALAFDPVDPGVLYLGGETGFFKSTNEGNDWTKISIGSTDIKVYTIAINTARPDTIYLGTNKGAYWSRDEGQNWDQVKGVPANVTVHALAIDPRPPGLVHTGTAHEGLITIPDSPPGFQKGITLVSFQNRQYAAADQSLRNLADTGANWIALLVTGYQETITSTIITRSLPQTPTDADLVHVITLAHELGLKVMLKPHVDLSNDPTHWRGQIGTGFSEAEWQAWFTSYRDFINHYADLAETHGVEQFSVGTELSATTHQESNWRTIIEGVRARNSGPILYAANWGGEETNITWWDSLDYIGIDAYYPLTTNNNNPSIAELKEAWIQKGYVNTLENLAKRYNKPIIFSEIGYRSVDGSNKAPWNWQDSATIDLQEQADCYQAVLETFWGKEWFAGIYWWNWGTDPNQGGANDSDFTPHNKPAEEVLKAFYAN